MTEYDIKCPKCGRKATAVMKPGCTKGTYREPMVNLIAERLICGGCGFSAQFVIYWINDQIKNRPCLVRGGMPRIM